MSHKLTTDGNGASVHTTNSLSTQTESTNPTVTLDTSAPEDLGADIPAAAPGFRIERDSLGRVEVPIEAYWGVHTKRALENFPIAKRPISVYPDFVVALASVKQACARANADRKSTRLNSSHPVLSRMPSSA